jgi:hypothetical protein
LLVGGQGGNVYVRLRHVEGSLDLSNRVRVVCVTGR